MRAAAATRMPTLGRVLEVWMEEYGSRLREATRTRAASYIRHELKHFARMAPTSLTDRALWTYVEAQIAEGKKPTTITGGLVWLRRAICLLWDSRYESIAWVPPSGLKGRSPAGVITNAMKDCGEKFSHLVEEQLAATPEECETLMAVTRELAPEWAPFMQLAIGTGMRRSELRALQWDCVDLTVGVLTMRRNFSNDREGPVKARRGKGHRKVRLPEGCVALLRDLQLGAESKYVFTHEGHFLRQWRVGHAMDLIFGEAEKRGVRAGLSLHALRRHYVSQGREHMSDAWMQEQVGHNAATQARYDKRDTVKGPNLDWADF